VDARGCLHPSPALHYEHVFVPNIHPADLGSERPWT